MITFILTVLTVAIICKCFFKKNFWTNRYLILLIIICSGVVTTMIANYIAISNLNTKVEIASKTEMNNFYVPDSIVFKDSLISYDSVKKTSIFDRKYRSIINDIDLVESDDSVDKKHNVKINCLITLEDSSKIKFIFYNNSIECLYYVKNKIFVESSKSDTIGYYIKKKLKYNTDNNNWVVDFSLPTIKTIYVVYLPEYQYKLLPDSLITKPIF